MKYDKTENMMNHGEYVLCTQWQWCSGKITLVGTLAWHYGHISYRYRGGGGVPE